MKNKKMTFSSCSYLTSSMPFMWIQRTKILPNSVILLRKLSKKIIFFLPENKKLIFLILLLSGCKVLLAQKLSTEKNINNKIFKESLTQSSYLIVKQKTQTKKKNKSKIIKDISKKMTILILGDSLTAGYGVNPPQSFPHLLEKNLNSTFKPIITKVISAGISGSTSASAPPRIKRLLHTNKNINVLMIALGSNDGLRGLSVNAMKNNLQKTIDLSKEKKIKVILAGMKLPLNYGEKYSKEFSQIFTDLAKENKLSFIPFLLEGVGGVSKLNIDDGIHPNEKGHKRILKNILPFFTLLYKK